MSHPGGTRLEQSVFFKKSARAFLSAIFFLVNGVFVHAAEANFWSERRRLSGGKRQADEQASLPHSPESAERVLEGLPPLPALTASLPFNAVSTKDSPRLASSLPAAYGAVRKVSVPPQGGSKTVIHIHDVHLNPEAQKNIGKALQELIGRREIDLVALEGAFGTMDLSGFRSYQDQESVRKVADFLLEEKRISGAIHTAFTSGNALPPFIGVDDDVRYRDNVGAYRRSVSSASENKRRWAEWDSSLAERKASVFSAALREFDAQVQAYRSGRMGLGDFVRGLAAQGGKVPPRVSDFLKALEMESALDLARVESERSRLLEGLVRKLSKTDSSSLVAHGAAYRSGGIRHKDFYQYLRDLCRRNGMDLSRFPAMDAYVRYILMADRIDAEGLFEDLRALEAAGYDRLSKSPAEKALVSESRRAHLTAKLLDFSLSADEWDEYAAAKRNPGVEGLNLSSHEAFYEEARARDEAIARNLQRAMDERGAKTAVLVAGGFHAAGLKERLNRAGVTTIAFVPKITQADPSKGSAYLSVFSQEKTPLEKLFQGDALFVSPHPLPPHVQRVEAPQDLAAVEEGKDPRVDFRGEKELARRVGADPAMERMVARDDGAGVEVEVGPVTTRYALDGDKGIVGRMERTRPSKAAWHRLKRWIAVGAVLASFAGNGEKAAAQDGGIFSPALKAGFPVDFPGRNSSGRPVFFDLDGGEPEILLGGFGHPIIDNNGGVKAVSASGRVLWEKAGEFHSDPAAADYEEGGVSKKAVAFTDGRALQVVGAAGEPLFSAPIPPAMKRNGIRGVTGGPLFAFDAQGRPVAAVTYNEDVGDTRVLAYRLEDGRGVPLRGRDANGLDVPLFQFDGFPQRPLAVDLDGRPGDEIVQTVRFDRYKGLVSAVALDGTVLFDYRFGIAAPEEEAVPMGDPEWLTWRDGRKVVVQAYVYRKELGQPFELRLAFIGSDGSDARPPLTLAEGNPRLPAGIMQDPARGDVNGDGKHEVALTMYSPSIGGEQAVDLILIGNDGDFSVPGYETPKRLFESAFGASETSYASIGDGWVLATVPDRLIAFDASGARAFELPVEGSVIAAPKAPGGFPWIAAIAGRFVNGAAVTRVHLWETRAASLPDGGAPRPDAAAARLDSGADARSGAGEPAPGVRLAQRRGCDCSISAPAGRFGWIWSIPLFLVAVFRAVRRGLSKSPGGDRHFLGHRGPYAFLFNRADHALLHRPASSKGFVVFALILAALSMIGCAEHSGPASRPAPEKATPVFPPEGDVMTPALPAPMPVMEPPKEPARLSAPVVVGDDGSTMAELDPDRALLGLPGVVEPVAEAPILFEKGRGPDNVPVLRLSAADARNTAFRFTLDQPVRGRLEFAMNRGGLPADGSDVVAVTLVLSGGKGETTVVLKAPAALWAPGQWRLFSIPIEEEILSGTLFLPAASAPGSAGSPLLDGLVRRDAWPRWNLEWWQVSSLLRARGARTVMDVHGHKIRIMDNHLPAQGGLQFTEQELEEIHDNFLKESPEVFTTVSEIMAMPRNGSQNGASDTHGLFWINVGELSVPGEPRSWEGGRLILLLKHETAHNLPWDSGLGGGFDEAYWDSLYERFMGFFKKVGEEAVDSYATRNKQEMRSRLMEQYGTDTRGRLREAVKWAAGDGKYADSTMLELYLALAAPYAMRDGEKKVWRTFEPVVDGRSQPRDFQVRVEGDKIETPLLTLTLNEKKEVVAASVVGVDGKPRAGGMPAPFKSPFVSKILGDVNKLKQAPPIPKDPLPPLGRGVPGPLFMPDAPAGLAVDEDPGASGSPWRLLPLRRMASHYLGSRQDRFWRQSAALGLAYDPREGMVYFLFDAADAYVVAAEGPKDGDGFTLTVGDGTSVLERHRVRIEPDGTAAGAEARVYLKPGTAVNGGTAGAGYRVAGRFSLKAETRRLLESGGAYMGGSWTDRWIPSVPHAGLGGLADPVLSFEFGQAHDMAGAEAADRPLAVLPRQSAVSPVTAAMRSLSALAVPDAPEGLDGRQDPRDPQSLWRRIPRFRLGRHEVVIGGEKVGEAVADAGFAYDAASGALLMVLDVEDPRVESSAVGEPLEGDGFELAVGDNNGRALRRYRFHLKGDGAHAEGVHDARVDLKPGTAVNGPGTGAYFVSRIPLDEEVRTLIKSGAAAVTLTWLDRAGAPARPVEEARRRGTYVQHLSNAEGNKSPALPLIIPSFKGGLRSGFLPSLLALWAVAAERGPWVSMAAWAVLLGAGLLLGICIAKVYGERWSASFARAAGAAAIFGVSLPAMAQPAALAPKAGFPRLTEVQDVNLNSAPAILPSPGGRTTILSSSGWRNKSPRLSAVDAADGETKWTRPFLPTMPFSAAEDASGRKLFAFEHHPDDLGLDPKVLKVMDLSGNVLDPWTSPVFTGQYEFVVLKDVNGDRRPDLVTGKDNLTVTAYDALSGAILFSVREGTERNPFAVGPLSPAGQARVVLNQERELVVLDNRGTRVFSVKGEGRYFLGGPIIIPAPDPVIVAPYRDADAGDLGVQILKEGGDEAARLVLRTLVPGESVDVSFAAAGDINGDARPDVALLADVKKTVRVGDEFRDFHTFQVFAFDTTWTPLRGFESGFTVKTMETPGNARIALTHPVIAGVDAQPGAELLALVHNQWIAVNGNGARAQVVLSRDVMGDPARYTAASSPSVGRDEEGNVVLAVSLKDERGEGGALEVLSTGTPYKAEDAHWTSVRGGEANDGVYRGPLAPSTPAPSVDAAMDAGRDAGADAPPVGGASNGCSCDMPGRPGRPSGLLFILGAFLLGLRRFFSRSFLTRLSARTAEEALDAAAGRGLSLTEGDVLEVPAGDGVRYIHVKTRHFLNHENRVDNWMDRVILAYGMKGVGVDGRWAGMARLLSFPRMLFAGRSAGAQEIRSAKTLHRKRLARTLIGAVSLVPAVPGAAMGGLPKPVLLHVGTLDGRPADLQGFAEAAWRARTNEPEFARDLREEWGKSGLSRRKWEGREIRAHVHAAAVSGRYARSLRDALDEAEDASVVDVVLIEEEMLRNAKFDLRGYLSAFLLKHEGRGRVVFSVENRAMLSEVGAALTEAWARSGRLAKPRWEVLAAENVFDAARRAPAAGLRALHAFISSGARVEKGASLRVSLPKSLGMILDPQNFEGLEDSPLRQAAFFVVDALLRVLPLKSGDLDNIDDVARFILQQA